MSSYEGLFAMVARQIWTVVNEMFFGDWFGILFGAFILLVLLVIISLVFLGLFKIVDSWFLPRQYMMGKVLNKVYTPRMHLIAPLWRVFIQVGDTQISTSVDEEFFCRVREGQQCQVECVIGRFSKSAYFKSFLD